MTDATSPQAKPTEVWTTIGDLQIRYLDWGGNGQPIMALHGLASSAHWYDLVAPMLRGHGRVIAPDQRGHGKTAQMGSGYDWQTLSEDIVGLMDHLAIEKTSVLGHSWGGNVAGNVAARFPERVDKLVMIDGGFLGGPQRQPPDWESFRERLRPRNVTGNREEFLERLRVQLAECWNSDLERIVQSMVYEDEQGQIQDILRPENHAQVIHSMWHEPPSTTLPRVICPTMIIPAGPSPERANSDFAISRREMVDLAAKSVRDCRVHWITNTMHDIGYHKPKELAEVIIAFLSEDR